MPDISNKIIHFFKEFKRRKVGQVLIAYAGIAAIIIGIIQPIEEDLGLWTDTSTLVIILLIIGLPIAGILTWGYQMKSKVVKEPEKEDNKKDRPLSEAQITPEKSIVVLPFENISSDPEQEYFSDGLTEEVITDLSHIHDLLVISRSSAMTFKGTKKKTYEIAKEVNVKYILEGSVRKVGNDLRITAQLINATNDSHLWAEKYAGTLDEVFDIQEKVSRSIVNALKVKLTPNEDKQIADNPINNIQAYECYLKARQEMLKWTEEGLENAIKFIQDGIKILGENELFYVGLSAIYTQYIHYGIKREESYLQKAEKYIDKVFSINPDSSSGHYLKGFTQWWRGNAKESVKELKMALTIDPNNYDSLEWLAWIYSILGKGLKAAPLFKKAIEMNPLNPNIYGYYSAHLMLEGNFETAVNTFNTGFHMSSESAWFRCTYVFLHAYNKDLKEANKYMDLIIKDSPQSIWAQYSLFLKYALINDKTNALNSVSEELKNAMKWNELYPILMADCYSLINEKEEAIIWLKEGIKWGCKNYPFLNVYNPHLANLRNDIRFKKLMKKVKKEWENFEI